MTQDQQVTKAINDIVYPNIEDRLKKGCQIICKYNGLVTLSKDAERYKDTQWFDFYGFDEEIGNPRGCKGNELLEVLGRKLDLEMLLMALRKLKHLSKCRIYTELISRERMQIIFAHYEIIWQLNTPYTLQSEETKKAIENIFCNEY